MNIDQLKIKGHFTHEVDKKYEIDEEVTLILKGSIVKHEIGSNQDGSVNVTAVFKPELIEIYEENDSDTRKNTQLE